ncbi:nucleoside hydrolase [Microbacterium pumilum]|uniref:Nucleoside hydrolase n=1 Tax=Microbacterium pumilum TaxID=344165 RepID=A0ABP5DI69_9MICO
MNSPEAIPLYLDCDTGIDDALALAYLLAEPAVRIVGIGTVSGNVSAERAASNTLALLELAGRTDIPVAVGATDPLHGTFHGGAPQVHGKDGVGGIGLVPETSAVVAASAVDLLRDLADEWSGQLHVLAVGPLTNLARFASTHPESVSNIADVVVMGGAFDRRGNVSETAEANIHNDPEAAAATFEAEWPITIVPLDITMDHALTEADARQIEAIQGSLPPQLAAMLATYLDYYEQGVFGIRQCALHDPLAAIIAADAAEVLREDQPAAVRVETEGEHRGRTVAVSDVALASSHDRRIVLEIAHPAAATLITALRSYDWP